MEESRFIRNTWKLLSLKLEEHEIKGEVISSAISRDYLRTEEKHADTDKNLRK